MAGRLQGRVAAVTGSSSGNGRAIALALAAEGASVVCSDLHKEALKNGYEPDIETDTDDLIRAAGGRAEYLDCDVADAGQVRALVERAASAFGRLDIMVNNAGILTGLHSIVEESEEQYDLTMDVNAKGVWLGCKYAIEQMRGQEPIGGSRGRIVNIASIGGLVALRNEPAYCMSKGAVVMLTKVLAVDHAPERINVNAVCPGFIYTALTRPYLDIPEISEAVHAVTPWPEIGRADDVAGATLYLASDEARWATGTVLSLDGGYTAP